MNPAHRTLPARWRAALLVGALVTVGACSSDDGSTEPRTVEITSTDGNSTTLAAFEGRPVVVNMWATWCGPCVAEMPAFETVASSTDAVAVIGVNVGDSADEAITFADDLGVTYPIFTDPDGVLSTALGVNGLPATAFLDADGTVLELHQGAYTQEALAAAIAATFPGVAP